MLQLVNIQDDEVRLYGARKKYTRQDKDRGANERGEYERMIKR